jgi:hypothetical protein
LYIALIIIERNLQKQWGNYSDSKINILKKYAREAAKDMTKLSDLYLEQHGKEDEKRE